MCVITGVIASYQQISVILGEVLGDASGQGNLCLIFLEKTVKNIQKGLRTQVKCLPKTAFLFPLTFQKTLDMSQLEHWYYCLPTRSCLCLTVSPSKTVALSYLSLHIYHNSWYTAGN